MLCYERKKLKSCATSNIAVNAVSWQSALNREQRGMGYALTHAAVVSQWSCAACFVAFCRLGVMVIGVLIVPPIYSKMNMKSSDAAVGKGNFVGIYRNTGSTSIDVGGYWIFENQLRKRR